MNSNNLGNFSGFKAVLFDLDGVITDTAHYHFLSWRQIASEIGINIDEAFNENLKGISRIDSLKAILKYGNKNLSKDTFNAFLERKNELFLKYISVISPKDVFPGILDLLHDLKNFGIKISLASNSKNGRTLLYKMELLDLFDYITDPSSLRSKPDPDIFLNAAGVLM